MGVFQYSRHIITQWKGLINAFAWLTMGGAFILFLVSTLSTPVLRTIYIMSVTSDANKANEVRVGIWGACVEGPTDKMDGQPPCTTKHLGFPSFQPYFKQLGSSALQHIMLGSIDIVFLFHVSGTGLMLVYVMIGLIIHSSRDWSIVCLLIGFLAAGAETIAFTVELGMAIVARNRLKDVNPDGIYHVNFGNALWIQFVGFLWAWGAWIMIFCTTFLAYPNADDEDDDVSHTGESDEQEMVHRKSRESYQF